MTKYWAFFSKSKNNIPGLSGISTDIKVSVASARSLTKRKRSKSILAPLVIAT
jgi:hypothetical protein